MMAHGVNDGFGWIIPPLLPAIREYFNLSYIEMGAFYTLYRFFGGFFQAPAAYLVHLAPIPYILAGGLLCASIGMFVATLSRHYGAFVWISAISGIGSSTYHPLAVTTLSRLFKRDALGRAVGLHLSGSAAGNVIAPLLVGLLLGHYTWRFPLQIWAVFGVSAGLALFFLLRKERESLEPKDKTLRWPFFSTPIAIYFAVIGIWGITQSGITGFLPLFLVDLRGFSAETAAATYGIMAFSGAACRPFLGALMDRMGRRKPVIIAGFILSGLSVLIITMTDGILILYPTIVLLGIFGAGHAGLADTFMIEMIPSHRREETLGFYYTFRMGISSLSPLLVGWISEHIGLSHSFLILAAMAGTAAVVLGLAEERPIE
jgi:MFS family permease